MKPIPIIYVPGDFADGMGSNNLQAQADAIATLMRRPVEIHTYGESEYHGERRYIGRDANA